MTETGDSLRSRVLGRRGGARRRIFGALALLVLAVVAVDVLADEPVRRTVERRMNERLDGYTLEIRGADFSPWNLSLELLEVTLTQDANPRPPLLALPHGSFSIAWRDLLFGRLVADLELAEPRAHVDLVQLRAELDDDTELEERGWREALQEAYPLEIQRLTINGGSLVYVDDDPEHPLVLSAVDAEARNIRNVRSPERTYPSSFELTAQVFGEGRAEASGRADFLADPVPAVRARYKIEGVPIDDLGPVIEDYRLFVDGGTVGLVGSLETTASESRVDVEELVVDGARVDFVNDPELTARAIAAVNQPAAEAGAAIRVERLRLAGSELAFVDRSREPDYRLFVSDLDATLSGWTNVAGGSPSELTARGAFMGNGVFRVDGTFRPDDGGANLTLDVGIEETRLASLNDLLRAWAGIDVVGGRFSLYTELEVADGRMDGYVKPLFADVDAYVPEQDREDGLLRQLWEGVVEEMADLLENRPRDEVATVTELEGELEDPDASNLQTVVNLIRNAFFEAILPGFAEQAGGTARSA